MQLPIYDHQQEILETIQKHRVVVIEGPAGTGKTTQLPRMLWHAGLIKRCIGITQPRRIAAVSVAMRMAFEEQVNLGQEVGYAIRFDDATSENTRIKVMTDGILLQEARTDPDLLAYDCIMIDEAHERSLNIDFSLGLLHRILARRKDLKLIVSSATLHPGHFQRYFGNVVGDVPLLSIKNRMYEVKVEYKPLTSDFPQDVAEDIAAHILRLHRLPEKGHILAFLPGEGLIKNIDKVLSTRIPKNDLIILPLYSRLKREEQELVFNEFDKRKVILSTNLAETSITIPDIRYVIDFGRAKLPWFNPNTGVTTLREEPISQSSAHQRAGRAGRTGPGIVIRLYNQKDLERWPEFTAEEILRADLSEAVLRLISLGVNDVERFDFPTPPPPSKLKAAIEALLILGAIDANNQLTTVGKQMVPFPLSPPLARMVVEAATHVPKAINDVLILAAFLSVRSPFLFPPDKEFQAKKAHRELARPEGDAMTAIHTFRLFQEARHQEKFCLQNFLDFDTLSFIANAHQQLTEITEEHGAPVEACHAEPSDILRCLATGFADKILIERGSLYENMSGVRAALHPSSVLYGTKNRFVVAAELMQAGRTYAFNVSALNAQVVASINPHAAKIWGLVEHKKRAEKVAPVVSVPKNLQLGDVTLSVEMRHNKVCVDIPIEVVPQLKQLTHFDLPKEAYKWRAWVITPFGTYLRDRLPMTLKLLRVAPLPTVPLKNDIELGVLLEPDRNLHTLSRYLNRLLEPKKISRQHLGGFLTLVANGGGGFWYDAVESFVEAVSVSLAALQSLLETEHLVESIKPELEELIEKFEGILREI